MIGSAVCVAIGLLGVEVGCQRQPDGSLQYIIQIEPELLDTLRTGKFNVESYIPDELRDVRSYQVRIGRGKLPRDDLRPPAKGSSKPAKSLNLSPPERPPGSARTGGALKSEDPPQTLPVNPQSKPVQEKPFAQTRQAAFVEPETTEHAGAGKVADTSTSHQAQAANGDAEKPKPWLPLTLALTGLCGSLGGNLYLAWLYWEARLRYRLALAARRSASAQARLLVARGRQEHEPEAQARVRTPSLACAPGSCGEVLARIIHGPGALVVRCIIPTRSASEGKWFCAALACVSG